jgi:hypothetical protein
VKILRGLPFLNGAFMAVRRHSNPVYGIFRFNKQKNPQAKQPAGFVYIKY